MPARSYLPAPLILELGKGQTGPQSNFQACTQFCRALVRCRVWLNCSLLRLCPRVQEGDVRLTTLRLATLRFLRLCCWRAFGPFALSEGTKGVVGVGEQRLALVDFCYISHRNSGLQPPCFKKKSKW